MAPPEVSSGEARPLYYKGRSEYLTTNLKALISKRSKALSSRMTSGLRTAFQARILSTLYRLEAASRRKFHPRP